MDADHTAGCTQLTSSGLSNLIQLRQLQELELTNCPGSSRELVTYLRDNLASTLVIEWANQRRALWSRDQLPRCDWSAAHLPHRHHPPCHGCHRGLQSCRECLLPSPNTCQILKWYSKHKTEYQNINVKTTKIIQWQWRLKVIVLGSNIIKSQSQWNAQYSFWIKWSHTIFCRW